MSQNEYAEYGEPLDFEDKGFRLRVFPHGRRVKLQIQHLNPPFVITRPKGKIDFPPDPKDNKGQTT